MGQKYSTEYKTDMLKLEKKFGVGAVCQKLDLSAKTVYNWRGTECL